MSDRLSLRLLTLLLLGAILAGCTQEDAQRSRTSALTPGELRTIHFEQLSDWHRFSGVGTLASSTNHSEGAKSVSVSGMGYIAVRNLTPLTKDDQQTPQVVGYDIWIPVTQPNPTWHGDTQLTIDAPSAGVYQQYLGYRSLQTLPKGQWVHVEFPVPNAIRTALNGANYTDLRVIIGVNVPPGASTHYLDNFTLGPAQTSCTPVSDNNVCTSDTCNPGTGQTIYTPVAPGTSCTDANACNGAEVCNATGACQAGTPPTINDGNACTADACTPTGGVTHTPVGAGTSCTDGNACNGAETCNATAVCQAGTPPTVDDGNVCTADACSASGGVTHTPVSAGTSCSDSNACNGAEACNATGVCQAGTAPTLDDGNACTADACSPSGGVTHTPVSAGTSCADTNACNGSEVCNGTGTCQAGTPPVLDDGNVCTADACSPSGGVTHTPVSAGTSCTDGNACNGAEACNATGVCQAETAPVVDDGNACTADACNPTGGVTHTPVSAGTSCTDGNACNGGEVCNGSGSCQAGPPPVVDDGNACTTDACSASGGVTHTPANAGTSCTDGNACNGAEVCNSTGACQAGSPPTVDDGNVCTADSCSPSGGVAHTPVSAGTSCTDANVCNGAEVCNGTGACQAGSPPAIDDGNTCTADACDPASGVSHLPAADGSSCSDGNACTTTDTCSAGACNGGAPVVCVAVDECHVAGTCSPANGACSSPTAPNGTSCDDGLTCSAGDACQAGECVGGDSPDLEEMPCHVAVCDETTGAVIYEPLAEGSSCSLDACTFGTCSSGGECIVTETSVLDDGNRCTIDYCDPVLGPVHKACSALDTTVETTVLSSFGFIFEGTNPVQIGIEPGTIEARRASLISGTLLSRDGEPLPSVEVTIHDHPEFGHTTTHANGQFELVVNGGGVLQVRFHKAGYLDSARLVEPKWNETRDVEPVVLIPSDPIVSEVTLSDVGTTFQVAQGSVQTDSNGSRQGTLLFPPGVQAVMKRRDGSQELVDQLHVRITEFTVGEQGRAAMPATLPANTGYTYAFEVGADEAVAVRAPEVEFSEPLPYYVQNFLGLPVGTKVPLGSYNRPLGTWIPDENGVVLEVVDIVAGVANLDVTGDGVADTVELGEYSIGLGERETIAGLYAPGATLWRVRLPHFTNPWDANWPYGLDDDAVWPTAPRMASKSTGEDDVICPASAVECQSQVYHEEIPLAGSPYRLHYSSARAPGRRTNRIVDVLPPAPVPESLELALAFLDIAGVVVSTELGAATFSPLIWDGLDRFGRRVEGPTQGTVTQHFWYRAVMGSTHGFGQPGSGPEVNTTGSGAGPKLDVAVTWPVVLGDWVDTTAGLGGWTLDVHHKYGPATGTLVRGDGKTIRAAGLPDVLNPINVGTHLPTAIATAPDGSIYACASNLGNDQRLIKVDPQGAVTIVAGAGPAGNAGDGGPATAANIQCYLGFVAVGPDGSVYFGSGGNPNGGIVRKVAPDGIISRVAGTGVPGYSGDGQAAIDAQVTVQDLAVDADGNLFLAGGGRIRQIGSDGIINTIAGIGSTFPSPAIAEGDARTVAIDPQSVAVNPASKELLFLSNHLNNYLGAQGYAVAYRLDSAGVMHHVAGCLPSVTCVTSYFPSVGVDPKAAFFGIGVSGPRARIDATREGTPLIAVRVGNYSGASDSQRIFTFDSLGLLVSPIGQFWAPEGYRDGAVAAQVALAPGDMAFAGDDLVIAEDHQGWIRLTKLRKAMPGIGTANIAVASEDGNELYVFDPAGRHLETRSALTGQTLLTFSYDQRGQLASITDSHGLSTSIERTSGGSPSAIIAPYGQRTELTLNASQDLSSVTLPGNRAYNATYADGGLLETFEPPIGGMSSMEWNGVGMLVSDEAGDGYSTTLDRIPLSTGWRVTRTTALDQAATYDVERQGDFGERRFNVMPDGTTLEIVDSGAGFRTEAASDGTFEQIYEVADPRWGFSSPLVSTATRLPSGLTVNVNRTRDLSFANPADRSTLLTQTDVTTVGGATYRSRYTLASRTFDHRSPSQRLVDESVDAIGRTTLLHPEGLPHQRFDYDDDHLTQVRIDSNGVVDGEDRVTTLAYDPAGRLASVTDPLQKTASFTDFDAADRPTTLVLPDGEETVLGYDADGNLTSVTAPGVDEAHTLAYGQYGRLEEYVPPLGNAVQYSFDLDRHIDAIDFGLDSQGEPALADFTWNEPTGQLDSIETPTTLVTFGYEEGKLSSLAATSDLGAIATSLGYDGPLPTSMGWAGPVSGQVSWVYDARLQVTSETVGAETDAVVNYGYDADGLVLQAGALAVSRDPVRGRIGQKNIGNLRETFEYNDFNELRRVIVERWNLGAPVETLYDALYDQSTSGDRDNMGRIVKKTERIAIGDAPGPSARALGSHTYDYGYNAEGRSWLETVAVDGAPVSTYAYDPNGNRVSAEQNLSQLGYAASLDVEVEEADTEYNDADQAISYGALNYTFNPLGQLEQKVDTATSAETTYRYDVFGNLLETELPNGHSIQYLIDGAGRRVARRRLNAQGTELEFRGWVYRDGLRPIAEVDVLGKLIARYVYSDAGSAAGWNAPDYIQLFDEDGDPTGTYYLIKDQVGTVELVVDTATGQIVQRMEHDEFGRVLLDSNPGFQPFGFAGGIYDADTKLVRFGARDYDPMVGRWTTRDPALFAGGDSNLYAYAASEPVNLLDPEGRSAWGALGATIGGYAGFVVGGGGGALAGLGVGSVATAPVGAYVGTGIGASLGYLAGEALGNGVEALVKNLALMGRKNDIKEIDDIVRRHGLNKHQRDLLHREITGQDLSREEIEAIAAGLKGAGRKWSRNSCEDE